MAEGSSGDAATGVGPGSISGALPDADGSPGAGQGKPRGRWWRGFTGSVAAGMAALAVGVLAVWVVCWVTGAPGPGVPMLAGHPVAAVAGLALQRVADRRNGRIAGLAGGGVLVVAVVALLVFWWV
ncbi:hypothetical protein ATK36_2334 [Amycolatopsis sulphurea]|uniref:Uncharacterized protein n=1 Tax=Amycolatopsis sulphurea TaxID=76022 RepID=A0A2A9F804_9PSEU|nr:hypothetical protein [Amycolatopsis sulphurea]PFG47298.1 hypothetical protein ATK36_2334 [Amycolatopsis sulphurea]